MNVNKEGQKYNPFLQRDIFISISNLLTFLFSLLYIGDDTFNEEYNINDGVSEAGNDFQYFPCGGIII